MNEAILATLAGLAGVVLSKLSDFILGYRKDKREAQVEDREQISKGYRTLIEQLQARQALLSSEMDRQREEHTHCRIENEQLRGDIRLLQANMNQLRVTQLGMQATSWVDALVITDDQGKIVEWNQAATLLFHYTRDEAVGQLTDIIVPKRFREAQRRGLEQLRGANRAPTERLLSLTGQTKEGAEVPVELSLTGWTSGDRWFYGATIRRRYEPESAPDPARPS